TLRDLLIDAPVFWVARPEYLGVCVAGAVAIWIFGWGQGRERLLLWLDAVGMAAYPVVGALKAVSRGLPPGSAIVMGVLTSTFGGIIRDVLAEEPSVLLRRELYVTPALLGSAVFVGLDALDVQLTLAGAMGFIAAFTVRAGAILFGWQMPAFPGRAPPGS
ncbi:MAG: trimeric intracellular cation channel family protein, partial [Phenylobacterium sp.]|nr:trimeric intracellular cation channel family protein [Phenylobacterium sp.]